MKKYLSRLIYNKAFPFLKKYILTRSAAFTLLLFICFYSAGAAAGYISYNGQNLWWDPWYPNYGFNPQTSSYVKLEPGAALFQWKDDKWVPVMTDQQGNLQPQ